jgi:hypothetical protein
MATKAKRGWPTLFGLGWGAAGFVEREEGPPNPRSAQRRRTVRHGGRGRALGLVAAGSVAVLFAAPLAWSDRAKPCEAAEVALVSGALGRDSGFGDAKRRLATWAAQDGRLLSRGRVGEQLASREYAGWPPFAGCTAVFWRARAASALGW